MARSRGKHEINVAVRGEADFGAARKDITKDLDKISAAADDTADEIKRAFANLSPELDTSDIKRALDLAGQLDGMVANLTVDTDLAEIQEAEKIARSLRAFQGRVDLSVEGRAELSEALGLAEKMDQIRSVKVQVQGVQDLERAEKIARDLDGRRIEIPIDARADDLVRLDAQFADAGASAGDAFADGFDVTDIGGSVSDQLGAVLGAGGPVAAIIAPAAVAFGDDFIAGFTRGFGAKRTMLQNEIQTNFAAVDLAPMGEAAGEAYAAGFGEGLQQLTQSAATLETALRQVDGSMDLTQTLKSAQTLDEYLGVSIPESSVLAARMVRQGLAKDTVEAFDLMTYAAAQYGETGVESLELTKEFGGVIGRLGIDGPAAVDFINKSFVTGLLPTIDRGAELFEEFNIIMTEGGDDARQAITGLGLDFEQMQRQILQGGEPARQAIEDITGGIMRLTDETQQSEAITALFGMTLESATDRPEVIAALNELSTATLDVGGASENATEKVEQMQTAWDKASKRMEEVGALAGQHAAGEFNRYYESVGLIGDAFGFLERQMLGYEGVAESAASQTEFTGTAMQDLSEHALFGRDSVDELSGAVADLDETLSDFAGRFDEDQVFRNLEEDVLRAIEATQGLTRESYNLRDGFDITTEAGRNAEAAMEDLSGNLDHLIELYQDGTIDSYELADGQRAVQDTIRQVAREMGLTAEETQALINKYGSVPKDVYTKVTADTTQAAGAIKGLMDQFGALRASASVPIRLGGMASSGVPTGGGSGGRSFPSAPAPTRAPSPPTVRFRAEGGPTTGLTVLGEDGPELVNFGSRSAFVHDAQTSAALMSGAGREAPPARVDIHIESGGSAMDDLLVDILRKSIRNRGGLDAVFS